MPPFALFRLASAALLLAACGPVPDAAEMTQAPPEEGTGTGETEAPGLADIELCDAPDYRPLIGTNIAAASLPEDPMLRAFGENDIVTQDYRPQRTNILYDESGEIRDVYCG